MFITVHAATATIIGTQIANPILAFLAGLISHFVLDIIPHGDENLGKKFLGFRFKTGEKEDLKVMALYGSIDTFFMVIFLFFMFRTFNFISQDSVIWAIIGGILPDVLVAFHKLTKIRILNWFTKFHSWNHRFIVTRIKADIPIKYGVFMQLIVMIGLVWIMYRLQ